MKNYSLLFKKKNDKLSKNQKMMETLGISQSIVKNSNS